MAQRPFSKSPWVTLFMAQCGREIVVKPLSLLLKLNIPDYTKSAGDIFKFSGRIKF